MSYAALTQLVDDLDVIKQRILRLSTTQDPHVVLAAIDALKPAVDGFPYTIEVTCVWHLRRAEVLLHLGQAADALLHARAAHDILGSRKKSHLRIDCLMREAEAAAALDDMKLVDQVTAEGIALAEARRRTIREPYMQAGYLRDCIGLYSLGIKAALSIDQLDRAIARAELSKARVERLKDTPEAASLRDDLRTLNAQITEQEQQGRDTTGLRARRRALWDKYMRTTEVSDRKPVKSVAQIQARLTKDEAVLYYFWIDRETLLRVVFDQMHCAFDTVMVSADDRAAMLAYIDGIAIEPRKVVGIDRFRKILWPEAGMMIDIIARAKRLVISPHRLLHRLPLHALSLEGKFVIERWTVRYVPGLAAFLLANKHSDRHSLISVGIGTYEGPNKDLKHLKNAALEAELVACQYHAAGWQTECQTSDVTEAKLSELVTRIDPAVFHIACHGDNVNADTPLESHLYLTNTQLDGLDIPLLGLSAATVFLSACSAGQRAITGRKMVELPGDDMHGLMAAFFAAGAHNVIATMFFAQDRAAIQIAHNFHAAILDGALWDIALATAIRKFMANKNNIGLWGRPEAWAPFFLVSLGSYNQEGEG